MDRDGIIIHNILAMGLSDRCTECGSKDLEWDDEDNDDEWACWVCLNCGHMMFDDD